MSISHALSNALSGLSATTRAADVVASNVANAMTEGYGRRELELTTRAVGSRSSGVSIVGISRNSDPVVTGERRIADGRLGLENTRADFYESLTRAIGQADEETSLSGLVVGLETSLIDAANHPESDSHLSAVVGAAGALSDRINQAADSISKLRQDADQEIERTVERLQSALDKVVHLNVEIQEHVTAGYDSSALVDQRQTIIDEISQIIPVKEVARDHGMVSLYTPGGAILLESKAADIEFSAVNTIVPEMNVGSGVLSGLTINGQPVSTNAKSGAISGGMLSGLFEVRDVLAPDAQTKLDAFARDLVERFQDSNVDPSLTTGTAGLFTDAGADFDTADELALSNRLRLNTAINPSEGGDLWRLRSGIAATVQGDAGDASILQNMIGAMQDGVATASGGFSSIERSISTLSSDLHSLIETDYLATQSSVTFATTQQTSLKSIELENGVDTDQEMQKLLIIERTYAANARVIETVDELLDQLLRIS